MFKRGSFGERKKRKNKKVGHWLQTGPNSRHMVCTLHKHPELPYLSNKSMFLFPGCECAKKIIFPSNPRMTLIFSAFGVHNSPFSKYGSFSSKLYPMCKDIKQTNKQTKVKQTKQKQYKTKHAIKDKKIKGTPYIHYLIPPWALFT